MRNHVEGFPPPFELFLVNTSENITYKNIRISSSSAWSSEDSVSKTNEVEKVQDKLLPLSSISIDKSDVYELEAIVSYRITIEDSNNSVLTYKINLHGNVDGELEKVLGTNYMGIDITNELIAC